MRQDVKNAMGKAHAARAMLRVGAISLDEAKRRVQPYINLVNEGGRRIAKEHGGIHRKVSATGFLR